MQWDIVIGLEIHVQLTTQTKLFCSCKAEFAAAPNTNTCPVCQGHPGVLPVMNEKALEKAVIAGLISNCVINHYSKFDRKNYFYPDLPKAYQISQFDDPICSNGYLIIFPGEPREKKIGITRIHIEEDAGKLVHSHIPGRTESYVDLNRAGTPLCEIVSEPDMTSVEEALAYIRKLREMLIYAGVSECSMEKGSFRCDANISLKPKGRTELGHRTEIKNMNSFKKIEQALFYEIKRQQKILEEGGTITTETLLFDSEKGETRSMRSKEEAHDYRYFPEPDLLPVLIDDDYINDLKKKVPEMPEVKMKRYREEYGILPKDARALISQPDRAAYFEAAVAQSSAPAKKVSNWICSEVLSYLNDNQITIGEFPISAADTGELMTMIEKGEISGKIAKDIFPKMCETGKSAVEIVEADGLKMVSNEDELKTIIEKLIDANPKVIEDYKAGRKKAAGFIVGQVMKATRGTANPKTVNLMIDNELKAKT